MSIVFITHHNENIYNIEKPPRSGARWINTNYISRFRKGIRKASKATCVFDSKSGEKILSDARKCPHKTMGVAEVKLNPPCEYLRKNQGVKWRRIPNHKCVENPGVPSVPRHTERPESLRKETKNINYIAVNIEKAKSLPPKKVEPRYIDTPVGESHPLEEAGFLPKYVHKKIYGKVPKYIVMIKKELDEKCRIATEQELMRRKGTLPYGIRKMTDAERLDMLAGLQTNHSELEKVYYRLPIFTDTQPKKVRKAKMEKDLQQFEEDMLLIENNPIIYICEE